MQETRFIHIAQQYKAVFFDSYGVLKNYKGLIEGAQATLNHLRDREISIRVLTNDASRSQEQQADSFARLGLSGIHPDEIVTSGMMAKHFLEQKIREGKIAYLGTENSAQYILQSGLEHIAVRDIDLEDLDAISAFVFLDDEGFDWNIDISKTVNILRRKVIPVIVANSDRVYPVSRNDVSIATGGIAELVENMLNKKFIHFGKPDSQMFIYAFDQLNRSVTVAKEDILMVGDTLHTDILGGNRFGLDTILVLSGNTRKESAANLIESTGIIPDYNCPSIAL
ncbi:MAG TPA: HAD-IIA family hydrolase [Saprospiraceae bacterium]|nr:HAD-IIA family hydrolase [Saprospiraceae bacterium]HPG05860.1 HAD-IIA family hydrolase [Saprospiraceae bacterium]HQU51416.1 HAD-IIA family hydrolase [Saprospiraceae bacterium]HRV85825.1 HAD-IIA family hydrolase [Saprospiraceae bacterium]